MFMKRYFDDCASTRYSPSDLMSMMTWWGCGRCERKSRISILRCPTIFLQGEAMLQYAGHISVRTACLWVKTKISTTTSLVAKMRPRTPEAIAIINKAHARETSQLIRACVLVCVNIMASKP